jgi:hypothetical protein
LALSLIFSDWIFFVSGEVKIPLVASNRNPTHTSLNEKGNFSAPVTRRVKEYVSFR